MLKFTIVAVFLTACGQTFFPTCDTPDQHCAPCRSDDWPTFCPAPDAGPARAPRKRVPDMTPMGQGIAQGRK